MLHKGVNIVGYFEGQFGLAEVARLLVSALKENSVPHSIISADQLLDSGTKTEKYCHCENYEKKGQYDINIFCTDVQGAFHFIEKQGKSFINNRYNILLFYWETNVIPKDKVSLLRCFDEIWVTTRYIQESISSVVRVPVHHIPQPMKCDLQPVVVHKKDFGLKEHFTFLFCFDFYSKFQRKNPEAVIESFRKAFPEQKDVQLVIKSQNGHHYPELLRPILNDIQADPRIVWMDESMSNQKRFELMNCCDCYVSLHRSEGFGLTMTEAMLLKKPVIATNYSGNLDFMTSENSYLCDYKLIPIGAGCSPYPAHGVWAECNTDSAAAYMQEVFYKSPDVNQKAIQGREDVLKKYAATEVSNYVAKRIKNIEVRYDKNSIKLMCKVYVNQYKMFLYSMVIHYTGAVKRRLKKVFSSEFNFFNVAKK